MSPGRQAYFVVGLMFVATLLNVVEMLLPRFLAAAMMATEMSEAMRPYSMAVAPDSSLTKRAMKFCIVSLPTLD
jgi:hypothetical protein